MAVNAEGFNVITDWEIDEWARELREDKMEETINKMIEDAVLDTTAYAKMPPTARNLVKQRSDNPIASSGYLTELASMGIHRAEVLNAFFKLFPIAGFIEQPHSFMINTESKSYIKITLEEYLIFVIRTKNVYMDQSLDYGLIPEVLMLLNDSNLTRGQIILNFLAIPKHALFNKAMTRDKTKNRIKKSTIVLDQYTGELSNEFSYYREDAYSNIRTERWDEPNACAAITRDILRG